MAKRDVVATERAINKIDLRERHLLAAIIQLAAYDIQQNAKKKRQAEAFLCGQHFQRICFYLGLDGNSIRDRLVSKQSQQQLQANLQCLIPAKTVIRRKQEDAGNEDADFDVVGDVELEPQPEPITYSRTFSSKDVVVNEDEQSATF